MKTLAAIVLCAFVLCSVSEAGIRNRKLRVPIPGGHPLLKINRNVEKVKANANTLVDAVMTKLRQVIADKNLDPLPLIHKEWNIIGVKVDFDGTIAGLSTIHRTADANLDFVNGTAVLSMEIGVDGLDAHADLIADFTLFKAEGTADADVAELHSLVTAVGQSLTGPYSITEYKTDDIEDLTVVFTGFGTLIDDILDELATAVADEFEYQIFSALDGPVRDEINSIIGNLTSVSFHKAPVSYKRLH